MTVFYWCKVSASLVATGLLLWHMREVRRQTIQLGRWLRYLVLLFFAVLLTGASIDQMTNRPPLTWYIVGGLVGSVLLVVATGFSIAESRETRTP